MVYWVFKDANPMLLVLIICPLLSLAFGAAGAWLRHRMRYGLCISFLLPLLFIAVNLPTLAGNIDSWLMYGLFYVSISYFAYKITSRIDIRLKQPK